jgi:hypothetical protein
VNGSDGREPSWLRDARRPANAIKRWLRGFSHTRLPDLAPALGEKQIENCQLLSNRFAILERMKTGGVVAEVGVQTGTFSRRILETCAPAKLHLLDIDLRSHSIGEKFKTEVASGVVELHEGDSSSILRAFPDNYFDFIYVDADHSYQGVKRDIAAGASKVKRDGFLLFNDYTYWSPVENITYGVVRAVNELCIEDDWGMAYFALANYMYCDVALQRRNTPPES